MLVRLRSMTKFHNGARVRQTELVVRLGPQTSTDRKHRKVKRLWEEQDGKCYWCQEQMVLCRPEKLVRHGRKGRVRLPLNFATLDHLDDRFSPDRGKRGGERRIVLACKRCNELRGRIAQASQPIEVLRARAGRGVADNGT